MATTNERRKLRREFRRKGYSAVYHEVNGYPPGKREFAHEWLREREGASDRRQRWGMFALLVGATAAVMVVAYFVVVQTNMALGLRPYLPNVPGLSYFRLL